MQLDKQKGEIKMSDNLKTWPKYMYFQGVSDDWDELPDFANLVIDEWEH